VPCSICVGTNVSAVSVSAQVRRSCTHRPFICLSYLKYVEKQKKSMAKTQEEWGMWCV